MILYLCVLIVFSLHRESLKLILVMNPSSRWFCHNCEDLGMKICYASVAHQKSNGQVERANAEILKGLKTRTYVGLKKQGKRWIDELPYTLWGNRTSPSRATRETHFFTVYGVVAVLPPEVTMDSLCV
jgi:hypothetical protein